MREYARKTRNSNRDIYKGIFLWCALPLQIFFYNLFHRRRSLHTTPKILIIHTCLIGEFAASLPALATFLEKNPGAIVDIMVSPPLKPLVEKIHGIRNVFCATSMFNRTYEHDTHTNQNFDVYTKIIILIIGPEAQALLSKIKTNRIELRFLVLIRYGLHLGICLLFRRRPRPWSYTTFQLLGLTPQDSLTINFHSFFHFTQSDEARIQSLQPLQTNEIKVIIHTGGGWAKCWNNDKWIELLKQLHHVHALRFIFIGNSNHEEADYQYIATRLSFPVYSLIGKTNVAESLLVLRMSNYFIGVDSGPRNLAHVVNLPSIVLMGPGPHIFTPPNPRDITIDRSGERGLYQMFFRSRHPFIEKIKPADVLAAFRARISSVQNN